MENSSELNLTAEDIERDTVLHDDLLKTYECNLMRARNFANQMANLGFVRCSREH